MPSNAGVYADCVAVVGAGVNRKWRNVGPLFGSLYYFRCALLVDFINTNDGMHWNKCAADIGKFGLQVFLGRIDNQ